MANTLYLVGLGLKKGQLTLDGMDAIKRCPTVYLEGYTSEFRGVSDLAVEHGAEILPRDEVEEGVILFNALEKNDVCLLVVGDPLSATTHQGLVLESSRRGFKTRYIPGISVMNVLPNMVGLSIYKFGRTTTLQYPEGDYFPTTPYEVLEENLQRGLHTMMLLDIQAHKKRYMTPSQAFDILRESERRIKKNVIQDSTICITAVDVFGDRETVACGTLKLLEKRPFPQGLSTLMFPGNMHFVEEESLARFAIAND